MEDDFSKYRSVYATLEGGLLGVPKEGFKWILTYTTQHRASEIMEFHGAK